jgi:hypothetical protein
LLITIPAADFRHTEGLSPAAERGLAEALGRVADFIEQHGLERSPLAKPA